MSRAIKKRTNYNKKIQLVKNEVDKENKAINRIWTLEGITFIAFVATLISSYFLFALSTWEQVSLIPKRNMQYSQIETYQTGRMQMFENFRKAWTEMRNQYAYFIYDCATNKKMTEEKQAQYTKQNRTLAYSVMDSTAGVFEYYFGSSIHSIYLSELNWYLNYINKCPISYGESYMKMNENLYYRQNILMALLLHKSYNPSSNNNRHDNPYYEDF